MAFLILNFKIKFNEGCEKMKNKVIENYHNHDVNSPLLIGNIEEDDIIKRRYK